MEKAVGNIRGLGDEKEIAYCKAKVKDWQKRLQQFIDDHEKLKRDYSREKVY